ncbi:MAG: putative DNA-binding protein [Bacillota bacterium]
MESFVRINLLFDFYGQLLTEKQQQAVQWYYGEDFSLAEIAAELKISRQAVHDLLRRSEQALEEYEEKLGLARHYAEQCRITRELSALLQELQDQSDQRWQRVFELLTELGQ